MFLYVCVLYVPSYVNLVFIAARRLPEIDDFILMKLKMRVTTHPRTSATTGSA